MGRRQKASIEKTPDTVAKRIGNRLRRVREAQGMSQSELGEKVGLNSDRIQKYENGARRPRPDMLEKLACALGVDVRALEDPTPTDYVGVMYTLIEMAEKFAMKIDDTSDGFILRFGDGTEKSSFVNKWLWAWQKEKVKAVSQLAVLPEKKEEEVILAYRMWTWNLTRYEEEMAQQVARTVKNNRITALEERSRTLQEQIKTYEMELSELSGLSDHKNLPKAGTKETT